MKPYTTNPQCFEWFSHNNSLLPFTFRTFLKFLTFVLIILTSTLVCCSCGSTKVATQLVRDVRIDTVYMTNQQYDSIYIYKDKLTDRSRDTIYIKDVSIEYRYKMLRDTVKVIQRDSIPYEVTVIETKESVRPLTWYDHLTRSIFGLLVGILFVKLVRFVIYLKMRIYE